MSAMAADPQLLPEQERVQIEELMAALTQERQGTDAARIEAACKDFATDILVSAETARRIPRFRKRPAGEVHLRGKSHAEQVFFLDGRPEDSEAANDLP